jgi:Co/Zn/Cd efflux system component
LVSRTIHLILRAFSHSIGGYLANSLAIITDAAHLLSDFASFLISLLAIWFATRPSTSKLSYGWHRAGKFIY